MTENNGNNRRNVLERLHSLGLLTNSSMPFLIKAGLMKVKAMLFSTLVTLKQKSSHIQNPVKHL